MARYRLLAVDLDGTLLSSRREIPEENVRAIRDADAEGVAIAVVTGRRFPALEPFLRPLGIDPFVVANSGALIRQGLAGPILQRRLLSVDVASAILELSLRAGMEPILHDGPDAEGHIILRTAARGLPAMGRYLNKASPAPRFVEAIEVERAPVQVGFAGGVDGIRALEATLLAGLRERGLAAATARTEYPDEDLGLLDVLSVEATKSKALDFLCRRLGIERERAMAIGDNWNDLEMLESAGLGVLMANASPELQKRGLAATLTNDEAGVAHAIRRYLLAGNKKRG